MNENSQKSDSSELLLKDLERESSRLDVQNKVRRRQEVILMLTCVLCVIYAYPVRTLDEKAIINIPFLSIAIPLKAALTVFPTIIAVFYLSFIAAAIRYVQLLARCRHLKMSLEMKGQKISLFTPTEGWEATMSFVYLLVPSILVPSLSQHGLFAIRSTSTIRKSQRESQQDDTVATRRKSKSLPYHDIADLGQLFVMLFVVGVFSIVPYASAIYITGKTFKILHSNYSNWILSWDILCLLVMLVSLFSSIMRAMGKFEK